MINTVGVKEKIHDVSIEWLQNRDKKGGGQSGGKAWNSGSIVTHSVVDGHQLKAISITGKTQPIKWSEKLKL